MSAHPHAAPVSVGGKLFNTATMICGVLIAAIIMNRMERRRDLDMQMAYRANQ